MTKISKRLESLVSFVDKKDRIVDVGCDHGYLSIYLKENNLCENIIATDVNKNALQNAIDNISRRNLDIETYLSDGINDIDLKMINTILISGMGTATILHILEDDEKLKNINKLIIQSNNDYEILRRELNKKGYYLKEEKAVCDNKKWYLSMLFEKNNKVNSEMELVYGFLNNQNYSRYLLDYYNNILKKVPVQEQKIRKTLEEKIQYIQKAISLDN